MHPADRASAASQQAEPPLEDGYTDYAGIIHVHTTYSHDAHGRFEDVVRVANAQRLDYVILTEHNNLHPLRDGLQGWHGATLVLVGMEISARDGHYLALNVTQEINRDALTTQQVIDEVARQGGLGFIAHPYFKHGRWRNWNVHGFTGVEAYNVAHDTLDENRMRLVLWTLTTPAEPFYYSILDRPYDPLAKWDELIRQHGHVVGIGSADAHEFHLMGIKFASYDDVFQLVRTHVLLPEPPLTAEKVYSALKQGHAFMSIGLIGNAKGFAFVAQKDDRVLGVMGDSVELTDGLHLTTALPAPANLTLFRGGVPVASFTGTRWRMPVDTPGVYRVEAMRHGKPWIFSNPIYVRPAAAIVDSPTPHD
ncbi:MAG: CehA/McbA family metallohydrolase [Candidatus Omnitrophica bacterium]|nr:CehA/McbA family metallohydrolase [Candidatus Omnitrophota bacterium]